jgi:hypothetical protein
MPDKTLESLTRITYLVESLVQENQEMRKALAGIIRWNHLGNQNIDAFKSDGLVILADALNKAEAALRTYDPERFDRAFQGKPDA